MALKIFYTIIFVFTLGAYTAQAKTSCGTFLTNNKFSKVTTFQKLLEEPPKIDNISYSIITGDRSKISDEDRYFDLLNSYESLKKETDEGWRCETTLCTSLSLDERISIKIYTGNYFGPMNAILRKGTAKEKKILSPVFEMLSCTLRKLETFRGQTIRGADQAKFYRKYIPGAIIVENAYTSTTMDLKSPYSESSVVMHIISKTGKILGELSINPYEDEVLFDKSTKFKILKRENVGNQLVITMEEVE